MNVGAEIAGFANFGQNSESGFRTVNASNDSKFAGIAAFVVLAINKDKNDVT